MLVLHGLFGSGTNWRSVGRALGSKYCVYLLDLRNHGGSAHLAGMSYAELGADVHAWILEHIGQPGEPVVLIGHSMGGKAAMWLALEGKLEFARLCIVDIAPVHYHHPEHAPIIDALMNLPLGEITRRSDADRRLGQKIPDAGLRQFLLQNLVSAEAGNGYTWRINLPALRDGLNDLLDFEPVTAQAIYRGHTHFIRGAASHYLEPPRDEAVRRCFPNATIASIDGAGHWPHAEQPKAFLSELELWLNAAT